MKKDDNTFKRGLVAGIWGTVFIVLGGSIVADDRTFLLFGIPLLGLPWLLFLLSDRSGSNQRTDAGEAIFTLIGGTFITLFCALPVVFAWMLLKKVVN